MTQDYDAFLRDWELFEDDHEAFVEWNRKAVAVNHEDVSDLVNHPAHYTRGRFEAIDVIEDAITDAPSNTSAFLQGQTLKYLLRLWHKENSAQDAAKARWYLDRLIQLLS